MSEDKQKAIFSKNLNSYVTKSGKNQSEIAKNIRVSPQTFNTWCKGIAIPRMGKVQTLADYFHINKSDLIEDKAAERMLENVCIDYKIKDGEEFHARDVLNSIDDPTLYSAISALNTLQIEILVLRCIGKKTFREIGKLVGRSELQAKNIYFNTLTKLRKIIGEK